MNEGKVASTRFPVGLGRAMADHDVEIDGMRVLFDRRVTLFPVTLVETPPVAAEGTRDAADEP